MLKNNITLQELATYPRLLELVNTDVRKKIHINIVSNTYSLINEILIKTFFEVKALNNQD